MFRQMASQLVGGAVTGTDAANQVLTLFRPSVLAWYLEQVWANRPNALPLGVPPALQGNHRLNARQIPLDAAVLNIPAGWHHIVYAYMIESTNAVEVFRRVVHEYVHGERLPLFPQPVQWWARVTEELFFMPPSPYAVFGVTSDVRPDGGAVRRNGYYRLLGWEVPTPGGRPGGFVKAEAANRDFGPVFETLLREVWRAYANRFNFLNENQTDRGAIRLLLERLRDMLNTRRYEGLLSREEFAAVATMSWFHLAVQFDTVVVTTLGAQGQEASQRLRKIAERVGVPVHSRADAFFRMAEPMSVVLRAIENGGIPPAAPDVLWNGGAITQHLLTILTNWPLATGRNVKDARPAVAPAGTPGTSFGGNGIGAANVMAVR